MANNVISDSADARRHFLSSLFPRGAAAVAGTPTAAEHASADSASACETYNLLIISPSHRKECGIGRYSLHAAEASKANYKAVHVLETTYQALRFARNATDPCIAIFQHEYSLVDFQYDLGEDDTTASVLCNFSLIQQLRPENRTAIFMHSMFLLDHGLNRINRQLFSGNIPIFHTNRDGCAKAQVNFTELGIPDFGVKKVPPLPQTFTVGAFGFLSPNKDVRSTLELCARAGVSLRANYAPNNTGTPQAINDARKHVEAQIAEMNVTGKVTFDFMTDDELKLMLAETSVIYAPQHDFAHYATSASVRFPLAVGRGAIVPPYRCFHDVAAGVQFAQLEDAVRIVSSMAQEPAKAEQLAEMGLEYAKRNEIGRVYRSIGERLIQNQVWCGGNPTGFRLPSKVADIRTRITLLDGHDPWSIQNEAGRENTGRGMEGGFFTYENDTQRIENLSPTFQLISERLDQLDTPSALRLALDELRTDPQSARHLRSYLGSNAPYLSVTELCALPSYLKALVFLFVLGLDSTTSADHLLRMRAKAEHDLISNFILSVDGLLLLARTPNVDSQSLVWGNAILREIDWLKTITYPEHLLSLPAENFVTGVFRTLLRRDPEPSATENLRRALAMGMRRSDVVFSIAHSEEGQEVGIELAGTLVEWRAREAEISTMVEMSRLIAPAADLIKSQNLDLKGRIYANVVG